MDIERRTPERMLILGCTAFNGFDSVEWGGQDVPNIPDYDLVIVSVPHITEDFLKSVDGQYLKDLRKAFVQLLDSGGKIVVLVSPTFGVKRPTKYPEYISNTKWCPIRYETTDEAGKSILRKKDAYGSYLNKMSEWSFFLTIPHGCLSDEITNFYGSKYHTQYKVPLEPYLENRYGRILSGHFHVEVRKEREHSNDFGASWTSYPESPDIKTGIIVLLPLIDRVSPEEALAEIIQEEVGHSLKLPEPDWAQNIKMPGVPELVHQVMESKKRIGEENMKVDSLEQQISDICSFRRLLFGTGNDLEEIVKRSLENLGAKVSPSKYSQEEYILEFNGQEYLMEVKGVVKSISLTHIRQLNDYLLKYQEDTGKECKGILFGNSWRNTPPEMRGTEDKQEFPDNVIKRAEQWGISLVSSRAFFEAFVKALETPKLSNDLLVKITSSSGQAFSS